MTKDRKPEPAAPTIGQEAGDRTETVDQEAWLARLAGNKAPEDPVSGPEQGLAAQSPRPVSSATSHLPTPGPRTAVPPPPRRTLAGVSPPGPLPFPTRSSGAPPVVAEFKAKLPLPQADRPATPPVATVDREAVRIAPPEPTGNLPPALEPITAPNELIEPTSLTPPPLPPVPKSPDVESWFESQPTRPADFQDLASLPGMTNPGAAPRGEPTTESPVAQGSAAAVPSPSLAVESSSATAADEKTTRDSQSQLRRLRPVVVASVVSLVVGVFLGALLFSSGGRERVEKGSEVSSAAPCHEPSGSKGVETALASPGEQPPVVLAKDDSPQVALARPDAEVRAAPAPSSPTPPPSPSVTLGRGACVLRVVTRPDGAGITIDGNRVGSSPLEVNEAPCGKPIIVRLDKPPRFGTVQRRLVLVEGEPRTLEEELGGVQARLDVRSKPSGALVFLGGRKVGKTPLSLRLDPRERATVRLQLPGYRSHEQSVVLRAGKPTRVHAALKKEGSGPAGSGPGHFGRAGSPKVVKPRRSSGR
ncbi:MAG: PEGA domain-containing protein [Deltaproteobacteria bacterium]|nr:PEGA domain-containing protein [Deltaproteobacteria bacterium]